MKFEPFTIVLHDDGETLEQAHVHPDLTMLTTSVNGEKEPAVVVDTKHFLVIANAVNSAIAPNDQVLGVANGYCTEGDRCVCGGDLPRVREGCTNWVTPNAI